MSRNQRNVRCGFLFGAPEADATTWACKTPRSSIERTNSQSIGFSLNGTHLGLAKLHVTHSKDETDPESGFMILSNFFILNNMAERVGKELSGYRRQQVLNSETSCI